MLFIGNLQHNRYAELCFHDFGSAMTNLAPALTLVLAVIFGYPLFFYFYLYNC